MGTNTNPKVMLVTDLDMLMLEGEPMVMITPRHSRKYATQRVATTAEVVNLESVNLAKMPMFETV